MTITDPSLRVVRWRKYGKDRLYVSFEDGQRVGWLDLVTGESVLEAPDLSIPFDRPCPGRQDR